jgi:hypothetical protein
MTKATAANGKEAAAAYHGTPARDAVAPTHARPANPVIVASMFPLDNEFEQLAGWSRAGPRERMTGRP